ncbi:hypothetical protein EXM98_02935 [Clostridium botulinum]|uniref:hypothetical protein n=1 Tax=Clostridium botulinum TaxID=1491 RepID=UPI0005F90072|nr:hypothetical protein [Clostridium botulinum]MBN3346145.1 hypothetical protein [Clostridium botulinum]NFC28020.1 hypothetical protein [Clostridium botulinum]NFC61377.1 hypothetical protein [Clostridium botulinum]NFC68213.1 hypothetical protein [Clostridium botulinum]NFE36937.1 hypothetical protein [Clostridium botulinum]
MGYMIKQDGYTFKKIESKIAEKPYRVRCIETGEEKDSSISYEQAICLILTPINSHREKLVEDSKDEQYVKNVFEKCLINNKLSELNEIVENQIAGTRIAGQIIAIQRQMCDLKQIYFTEHYKITAVCEYGRLKGVTSILIEVKK